MRIVSAREANRHFSDILGRVAAGEVVIITQRGEPVAQLVPYRNPAQAAVRNTTWDRLIFLMEPGLALGGGGIDRDALQGR